MADDTCMSTVPDVEKELLGTFMLHELEPEVA